jgi:hypothetical protein
MVTDIRPVVAVFYDKLCDAGAPPLLAARVAIDTVVEDLSKLYAISALDEVIIDRLSVLREVTISIRIFAELLRNRMRLYFWLNLLASLLFVVWFILVIKQML